MPVANIAALGATRKMLGFSRNAVEFEGATIAELLRQLPTRDGICLYDCLVCDGKLRPDFAIVVDGMRLRPDQLDTPLHGGEDIVTMAIVRNLAGG
jgi:hypothetical protein